MTVYPSSSSSTCHARMPIVDPGRATTGALRRRSGTVEGAPATQSAARIIATINGDIRIADANRANCRSGVVMGMDKFVMLP